MALVKRLIQSREHNIFALCRKHTNNTSPEVKRIEIRSIGESFDIVEELLSIDVVVHLAGLAHVMNEKSSIDQTEYYTTNVLGTRELASQSVKAGVRRFIFLSSLQVHGNQSELGRAIKVDSKIAPESQYAKSKYKAELSLQQEAADSDMEFVIIRPPLVYGAGVKANFRNLIKLVNSGIPLPLGSATSNRRSFVSLDNLASLIEVCLTHERAKNKAFLVSDDEDVSTTNLVKMLARALDIKVKIFPFPLAIIKYVAQMFGKKEASTKMLSSFQADISQTKAILNWTPELTIEKGLIKLINKKDN